MVSTWLHMLLIEHLGLHVFYLLRMTLWIAPMIAQLSHCLFLFVKVLFVMVCFVFPSFVWFHGELLVPFLLFSSY